MHPRYISYLSIYGFFYLLFKLLTSEISRWGMRKCLIHPTKVFLSIFISAMDYFSLRGINEFIFVSYKFVFSYFLRFSLLGFELDPPVSQCAKEGTEVKGKSEVRHCKVYFRKLKVSYRVISYTHIGVLSLCSVFGCELGSTSQPVRQGRNWGHGGH